MKKKIVLTAVLSAVSLLGYLGPGVKPCCEYKGGISPVSIVAREIQVAESDAPKVSAKAAYLLEANSGEVLFAKDADKRLPIASMTKIATLGVIYDQMAAGKITTDDKVLVSPNAASMGGSQAFLDANSEYTVRDLIQSIVVASANDSCVAMAEKLLGSTTKIVSEMNALAKRLGCTNTNFVNCTGLPATGAYSSAKDIAAIYAYIMKSPHFNDFNSVWMYDLTHPSGRITGLTNTNKLVRFYTGCTGGKTGFTTEAGHCITVTAARGDLRPIAVIIGADTSKTRFANASDLMNYAFDGFENKLVVDKTQSAGSVKLRGAVSAAANVYPAENFYQLTKKGDEAPVAVAYEIPAHITAPIAKEDGIGKIIITKDGKVIKEIAVSAGENIRRASYIETVKKVVANAGI